MFIAEMRGNRVSVWAEGRLTPLATPFSGPHHLLRGPDDRSTSPTRGTTSCAASIRDGHGDDALPAPGRRDSAATAGAHSTPSSAPCSPSRFTRDTLYIADLDNRRIRAVDLATGVVRTVAGNGEKGVPNDGADARTQPLVDPRAVAVDAAGQIYICERGGHALRVVDRSGRIRTVAGTGEAGFDGDGGPALSARFGVRSTSASTPTAPC